MSDSEIDLQSSDEEEVVKAPPPFEKKVVAKAATAAVTKHQLKNWAFTLFPDCYPTKRAARDELAAIGEEAEYLIAGKEVCPKTGRVHRQGFVIFKERIRFSALKKAYDQSIHWEAAKASIEKNIAYCSKEDKAPIVYGERPAFENNGEREKARWADARSAAVAGDLDKVDDQIFVCHYGNIRKIASDFTRSTTWLDKMQNFWLHGVPGSGKSHMARTRWTEEYGVPYVKMLNKWWDGYRDHQLVVVEDIDPSHAWMAQLVKIWTDKYPFPSEIKGACLAGIRPTVLVFTSNYSIEEIFTGADVDAIKRRFKVEHFPYPYGKTPDKGDVDAPSTPMPRFIEPEDRKKRKLQFASTQASEDSENEDEGEV